MKNFTYKTVLYTEFFFLNFNCNNNSKCGGDGIDSYLTVIILSQSFIILSEVCIFVYINTTAIQQLLFLVLFFFLNLHYTVSIDTNFDIGIDCSIDLWINML
jgi:hypothetical protein